jgi:hypothetical protein
MRVRLATALALSLAFTQIAAMPAFAEQPSHFRTAAPQTFSTEDLQRYGLSASDAATVHGYQDRGYQVVVMTPEQARQYQAGWSTNTWLIVGLVVIVVAVAVANN